MTLDPDSLQPSPVSWDQLYMGIAVAATRKSKDPRTQVGAVVVDAQHRSSIGYNGFPRGILDLRSRWHSDEKYELVIHAEMNAILLADGVDLKTATLYVTLLPCAKCALHIIQSGIRRVVYLNDPTSEATKKACARTPALFSEAGIHLDRFEVETVEL